MVAVADEKLKERKRWNSSFWVDREEEKKWMKSLDPKDVDFV